MSHGRKSACGGLEPTEPKDRCIWTEEDEVVLIEYITAHCSKGGDGLNFDKTFWTAAATEMAKHACSGANKTALACQSKWGWVCTILPSSQTFADELLAPVYICCS